MKKGIIFDVDGTLWDSSVQVAQSWQVAAEKLLNGPRPITPDMISRNMGKNMKDFEFVPYKYDFEIEVPMLENTVDRKSVV